MTNASADNSVEQRADANPSIGDVFQIDLRQLRQSRGLTLQALATRSNLTRGYLSLVERGMRVPSIAALVRLAEALEMSVPELIGRAPTDAPNLTISRTRSQDGSASSARMPYEALVPGFTRKVMEPFLVRPQKVAIASNTHQGEELIFVLRGTVELLLNGVGTELQTGDCAYFDARQEHKLRNIGPEQSEVLVVIAER